MCILYKHRNIKLLRKNREQFCIEAKDSPCVRSVICLFVPMCQGPLGKQVDNGRFIPALEMACYLQWPLLSLFNFFSTCAFRSNLSLMKTSNKVNGFGVSKVEMKRVLQTDGKTCFILQNGNNSREKCEKSSSHFSFILSSPSSALYHI